MKTLLGLAAVAAVGYLGYKHVAKHTTVTKSFDKETGKFYFSAKYNSSK